MKSVILKTSPVNESHTSENISAVLREVMDEWKLSDKIHCATTDSASKIKNE